MTGRELIDFIVENHLEDCRVMVIDQDSLMQSECVPVENVNIARVKEDIHHIDACFILNFDDDSDDSDGKKVILI